MESLFILWLVTISIMDIKTCRIPWGMIAFGMVLTAMGCILKAVGTEMDWRVLVMGVTPGVALLLLSACTKTVGYADGIVLIYMGALGGVSKAIASLTISLFVVGIYVSVLFVFKRIHRKTKIPYTPFLTTAWCALTIWMAGGS